MLTIRTLQTILLLFVSSTLGYSQSSHASSLKKEFKDKISELYVKYKTDGFITYKGGDLNMEKNTEFPIFVELTEGRWYQFAVIGDPEAKKIEMKLGLEGVGDFITDKFKPANTDEYWTTFSFICPKSGRYLLTFFQKAAKKSLLGHVAILQRPKQTEEGIYTFR